MIQLAPLRKHHERGYIMVVSVMITAVLTLMGFLVLHTVWFDSKTAYSDRQSQAAFHLAEAGVAWALDQMNSLEYDFTNFNQLLDEPVIACGSGSRTCPCELNGWRPLVGGTDRVWYPTGDEATSFGWFRVAVMDDVDGDNGDLANDNNQTVLIRSYGVSGTGGFVDSRRLIEVAVTRSF